MTPKKHLLRKRTFDFESESVNAPDTYFCKNADLYYNLNLVKEIAKKKKSSTGILDHLVRSFLFDIFSNYREEYRDLIEFNAKNFSLEDKIAILAAHGVNKNNVLYYIDGINRRPVQEWINEKDGKYKALILLCCNRESNLVSSKESSIIIPNNDTRSEGYFPMAVNFELYLPPFGLVDSYTLDNLLNELKKEVNLKK